MTDTDLLRQFAFWGPFTSEQRRHIAVNAKRVHFDSNRPIFQAGDRSDTMYLIIEGQVKITRTDAQGDEIALRVLSSGQAFGELALLSGEPRLASATTLTPCEFLIVDRALLAEALVHATPESVLELFAVFSKQMRSANEREFQELLAKRTLAAQMEAERQRSLTQMVAGVAHEINTPLGVIATALSIIERQLAVEEILSNLVTQPARAAMADVDEALSLMKGNIERAGKLVQDFKKIAISQLSDVKEPLNLPGVVTDTIELAKINLRQSGLVVEIDNQIPAENQLWIGYRGYLTQIVLNLLANIERYAYPQGQGGRAIIRLSNDTEQFVLS
ncbi:MAG TPA: cyclic nucleotide-binding domain-containing protein, partial [Anaerolineae bacterium]|nr:cyclic nucleotide-binding domain-containing protein [Anaerolineae bacterium]